MDKWEKVADSIGETASESTYRLKVEGGWLYRYDHSLGFVPVKDTSSLAGTGTPSHKNVFPTMRKEPAARAPTPTRATIPSVEDAEYEEVPPKEVNGSEVITARRVR